MNTPPILSVRHLTTEFIPPDGRVARALEDVSFDVCPGQTIGLVGESGCGKTTTLVSVMRLLPANGRIVNGSILFQGKNLLSLSERQMRSYRWKEMSIVFQGAMNALNPVMTVEDQICEPILLHKLMDNEQAEARVGELLELVGIPHDRGCQYPHQYSGGMRQRAMIAMALSCNPALLIADEPTTALDVTIQAQVLDLMNDLRKEFKTAILFITHDLGVIAHMADDVAVMYLGKIVEIGPVRSIFNNPRHPYTRGLMNSMPSLTARTKKRLAVIEGVVPDALETPVGCGFGPRCLRAKEICKTETPALEDVTPGHRVACWLAGDE